MKRYRKERTWFLEDESLPKELRHVKRTHEESHSLIAGADATRYQLPGLWRTFR